MDNPTQNTEITPPYSWLDTFYMLVQSPTKDTLERILADESPTAKRAYFQVMIGGILLGIALTLYTPSVVTTPPGLWPGIPLLIADTSDAVLPIWTIVILGGFPGAINSIIGFLGQTWLMTRFSALFGADHTFEQIAILRGIFYPVVLAIAALVVMIAGYDNMLTNGLLVALLMIDFVASAFVLTAGDKLSLRQGLMVVGGMTLAFFIAVFLFASSGSNA